MPPNFVEEMKVIIMTFFFFFFFDKISFYTSNGSGFEAFFTSKMVLVVATVTKKEFITTALREFPLTTQDWVS